MNKGPLAKGFKRFRDINSTYSLFDRTFQIIGSLFPGAIAASLAGWILTNVTWFWAQYGIVGVIGASIVFGAVIVALQLAAEFKLVGSVGATGVLSPAPIEGAPQSSLPVPVENDPIARSAIVTGGNASWDPQYRIEFNKSGRNAEIYIRFSCYASGFFGGGGWTVPVTVKLRDIERFIQGESLNVPIVYSTETPEGPRWAFGCQPDLSENGYPKYMLGDNCSYQGAIMLIGSDELVEWCFFVGETTKMSDMPKILGEHMWNHVYEWTGRSPPNRDPRRLFR